MNTALKIPPEFASASKDERIAYVATLWDRIAQEPDTVSMPEQHKRILDERLDAYRAHPQTSRPWGEVRDELLDELRRS